MDEASRASPLTGRTEHVSLVTEIDIAQLIEGYKYWHHVDVARMFSGIQTLVLLRDNETGLSFFRPTVVGDVAFYADIAHVPGYYMADKAEFRIARDHIPPGAKVCEVGAGLGLFRAHIPHADYIGLEFSEAALQHAAANGILLLRRDVEGFAAEHPGAYDVACAFQVLEHVADPLSFIAALVKLTKPGGKILLSTPNGESYIHRTRDVRNVPPHHVTWWEDRTWAWIMQRFSLSRLQIHHTPATETLMDWARMIAREGLLKLLGLELRPVVDETPLRRRIDALSEQTAMIIISGVRHQLDIPPVGHTTVAVFSR